MHGITDANSSFLYMDSSALVKLYVTESDSASYRVRTNRSDVLATSWVAYAEVLATLTRKLSEGNLSREEFSLIMNDVDADFSDKERRYDIVTPVQFMQNIGMLHYVLDRHRLRGFDAIHLASALILRYELQSAYQDRGFSLGFSSADRRLIAAAEAEGLDI